MISTFTRIEGNEVAVGFKLRDEEVLLNLTGAAMFLAQAQNTFNRAVEISNTLNKED